MSASFPFSFRVRVVQFSAAFPHSLLSRDQPYASIFLNSTNNKNRVLPVSQRVTFLQVEQEIKRKKKRDQDRLKIICVLSSHRLPDRHYLPMSADVCGDCGEQYVWDADASSGVCPQCGTLQDPSQNILAAHLDSTVVEENQVRYENAAPSSSTAYRSTTLKSFRNSDRNWDLPGQGKAAYAERAKVCNSFP